MLDFIRAYSSERGRPPTLREIGDAVGISSTNGVRYHLEVLKRAGLLEQDPMVSRGLRLLVQDATADVAKRQAVG